MNDHSFDGSGTFCGSCGVARLIHGQRPPTDSQKIRNQLEEALADFDSANESPIALIVVMAWRNGIVATRHFYTEGGTNGIVGVAELAKRAVVESEVAKNRR